MVKREKPVISSEVRQKPDEVSWKGLLPEEKFPKIEQ